MPRTNVVFYREPKGEAPVLDWLRELRKTNQHAYETCVAAIERLVRSATDYEGRCRTCWGMASMSSASVKDV
jgi:hypothetical protein